MTLPLLSLLVIVAHLEDAVTMDLTREANPLVLLAGPLAYPLKLAAVVAGLRVVSDQRRGGEQEGAGRRLGIGMLAVGVVVGCVGAASNLWAGA